MSELKPNYPIGQIVESIPFYREEAEKFGRVDTPYGTGYSSPWAHLMEAARMLEQLLADRAPQAGETEPHAWVYEFDDPDPQTDIEFGAECPKGWKRHIARGAVYPLYRTAPPSPVCPHLRSSDEGTQWCDLAAKPVTPGWQPISTAPRDEPFVGYFGNGEIHIVEIDSERNECFRPMDEERWAMPTHWQPLPSPPDSPGAGDL